MIVKNSRGFGEHFFNAALFSYLAYFEKFTRAGEPLYDQVYPKRLGCVGKKGRRNNDAGATEIRFSTGFERVSASKTFVRDLDLAYRQVKRIPFKSGYLYPEYDISAACAYG
jgi:hypothetical protein